MYVVPIAVLILGVMVVVLTPGHTNPVIRIGVELISASMSMAAAIAIQRAINNTPDLLPADGSCP